MSRHSKFVRYALANGLVSASFAVAAVPAQALAAEAPMPASEEPVLDDIVVTAQRRVERLQDVPISAQVLSGDALRDISAQSLREITANVPNVAVVHAGPSDRLFIRGIGSGDNITFDQSVATFIDGIYHGRSRSTAASFLDIDRVELLRGPQSVFFGNSAIAGAINVSTRRPTQQASASVSADYNFDWNEVTLEGAAGGPLSGKLSGRIAAIFSSGDGWLYDEGQGQRVPQTRKWAARGRLTWTPTADLSIDFKAEIGRSRDEGGLLVQLTACPPPAPFTAPRGFCPTAIASGIETQLNTRRGSTPGQKSFLNNEEYVLSADYDLGPATLTATTGYLRHRGNFPNDPDGPLPANLFAVAIPEHYRQFSQELRLASKKGGPFDYLFGLYYQHDRLATEQDINYIFQNGPISSNPNFAPLVPYLPLGQAIQIRQRENIYSAFGSLTYNATERFRIVGGLRYTIVKKDADKAIYFGTGHGFKPGVTPFPASVQALSLLLTNGLAPTVAASYARKDRHLSPSVNLQYDLTPDILAYATYANGFKSGGFNGQDTSPDQLNVVFGPETVNAFELGLKTQLLNRRMTLNLALFRSSYDDLQVGGARPFVTSPALTVQNAGGARSQGMELEHRWAISPNLTSTLFLVLLDSKYTVYPNANPTSLQAVQGIARQDLSGARTPYAPEFSGNWRLNYEQPLNSDLTLRIGGSLYFTTGYNVTTNDDPFLNAPGYVKLDATVGLRSRTGWDVSLLVRNLTNREYIVYGAPAPTSLGSYSIQRDPPRSFTLQARYRF